MSKKYNEWNSLRGHTGVVKAVPVFTAKVYTQKELDKILVPREFETLYDEWEEMNDILGV